MLRQRNFKLHLFINLPTIVIQEITAGSVEQTNGSKQISSAFQQFNGIIQQNASYAEVLVSYSGELSLEAAKLSETIPRKESQLLITGYG